MLFKLHIFTSVTLVFAVVLVQCINPNDITSWLTKSVCLDESTGDILSIDPFDCCKSMRKYQIGDPLVYSNIDQFSYQISDSYTLLDKSGQYLIFHSFDYEPFNVFNQHSGSDGYDVYSVGSEVVSITNTKDGGGYGSTFFGSSCSFGEAWVLFPTVGFTEPGQSFYPISGVYWEKNGEEFPGGCPNGYSADTLTSWELLEKFSFGGMNANRIKAMDTLLSYHGMIVPSK